jgi:hypothetical protein
MLSGQLGASRKILLEERSRPTTSTLATGRRQELTSLSVALPLPPVHGELPVVPANAPERTCASLRRFSSAHIGIVGQVSAKAGGYAWRSRHGRRMLRNLEFATHRTYSCAPGKKSDHTHTTYRVAAFQTFLSGRI